MKKVIILIFMVIGLIFSVNAQDISKNALGLRLGDRNGFGTEISYQKKLSDINRLEADLGWRSANNYTGYQLIGLYQWVWNIERGFNWYAGVGAGIGSWSYKNKHNEGNKSGAYFLAAGDIGIEYLFDFPLQLALDVRPELYLGSNTGKSFAPNIALSVRYKW